MPLKRRIMTLGLIPEVLDAVDVVPLIGEQFGVVDAVVLETGYIEHVVGAEGVFDSSRKLGLPNS